MPVAHKDHSGLTTAVWCGVASQALSAMEVSCRASLGPVSKREVTAGADHSAHLVPQPLCQPQVPPGDCYGAALSQGKRESAAESSEHRQRWFLLPPQKSCCSLLTQRACFDVHCL